MVDREVRKLVGRETVNYGEERECCDLLDLVSPGNLYLVRQGMRMKIFGRQVGTKATTCHRASRGAPRR